MSFRFHLIMVIKFYLVLALLLKCHGGDEEIRTPDPLLARQVLSQLSYTPINIGIFLGIYFVLIFELLRSSALPTCISCQSKLWLLLGKGCINAS